MGVLDEAIKHHLELKRRHGADPSEVAELEQEALGEDLRAAKEDGLDQLRAEFGDPRPSDPRPSDPSPSATHFSSHLHEETMEIDVPSLFSEPQQEHAKSVAFRY